MGESCGNKENEVVRNAKTTIMRNLWGYGKRPKVAKAMFPKSGNIAE
jgi:hypothetical protein